MKCNVMSIIMIVIVGLAFTACWPFGSDDDDNDDIASSPVYHEAGKFVVTNIFTGEEILNSTAKIVRGDKLNVKFIPDEKYKDIPFEIVYVLNQTTVVGFDHNLEKDITIEKGEVLIVYVSYSKDNALYKAERTINIEYLKEYADIVYSFNASEDFLTFITPQITFSTGKETIKKVHVTDDAEINVRIQKFDTDVNTTVSFAKKGFSSLIKDSYDMLFGFRPTSYNSPWGIQRPSISMNIELDVNIYVDGKIVKEADLTDDNGKIRKEFVEEYVNQIVSQQMDYKLHIDKDGKIEEIRD